MFLVEIEKGIFVNAEQINFLSFADDKIRFTLISEEGAFYSVCKEFHDSFLNHLQGLNTNNCAILPKRFNEFNKGE